MTPFMFEMTTMHKVVPRQAGDMYRTAKALGVEQDVLGAFLDVEAAGKGYDEKGRPKILFEKHKFYKNIKDDRIRDKAVQEGLARKVWIRPQAGGYADQKSADYKWLLMEKATNLSEDAALESASWGAGQIMGEHWRWLGYASVKDFVRANWSSEELQFDAMGRFLIKARLVSAMQRKDWNALARGYNGAGNVVDYAPKLRRAYQIRAGVPDEVAP